MFIMECEGAIREEKLIEKWDERPQALSIWKEGEFTEVAIVNKLWLWLFPHS